VLLRRWLLLTGFGLCAVIVWVIARLPDRPADPLYSGERLSRHLYAIYVAPAFTWGRSPAPLSRREIAKIRAYNKRRMASSTALEGFGGGWGFLTITSAADRAQIPVGPEALPLITNWLASAPPTGWKLALGRRLARFVDVPSLTANHQFIAWCFLSDFPMLIEDPDLQIFLPGLTNNDAQIRQMASRALGRQIRAGMKVDKDKVIRLLFPASSYYIAADPLPDYQGPFGYNGRPPLNQEIRSIIDGIDPRRELIPLYTLEMGQIPARVGAAMELMDKPRLPKRAIPLLISNLSSTNRSVQEKCALALGAYGFEARAALPVLSNLLAHPKERVRPAASNAITAIKMESIQFAR
jgi:hypothetical protein